MRIVAIVELISILALGSCGTGDQCTSSCAVAPSDACGSTCSVTCGAGYAAVCDAPPRDDAGRCMTSPYCSCRRL